MKIFLLIFLLLQIDCYSQIVINEFMAIPNEGEPEWIEIYNNSDDAEVISLFKICDEKSCKSLENIELKALSYNIFTRDTNALKEIYDIPAEARLFEMSMPGLNNDGDKIIIKINNLTVDNLFYDKNIVFRGKSTERVNYLRPANNKYNLGISTSQNNATPGKKNSILAYNFDLKVDSLFADDHNDIHIYLYDMGLKPPPDFTIEIFADFNRNGEKDLNEGLLGQYIEWDPVDYSMKLKYDHMVLFKDVEFFGEVSTVVQISASLDENYKNDKMEFAFSLASLAGTVLINEILFDVDDENSAEFVELFNISEFSVNLKNWQVLDLSYFKKGKTSFIDRNIILKPGDYAVVAWDSLLFEKFPELENEEKVYISNSNISLNDDSDLIVIISSNGHVIDSLTYFKSWHDENLLESENVSLERVELFNSNQPGIIWASSADPSGATPLRTNSVSQKLTSKYFIDVEPNPASFKEILQNIQIIYNIPFSNSFLDVIIFDEYGNEIIVLADGQYSQGSGIILWNGTSLDGKRVPEGLYICSFSARESETNDIYFAKKLIVIASN